MDAAAALRHQSQGCADLGSPMYADLCVRLAEDFETGGPTRNVLAGYEDAPGPWAIGLRLLGSVHRLVLERRAGTLAAYYPSVGGRWEADAGWRALHELLAKQPEAVVEWLDRPPQTNEIGRSAALVGGLVRAQNQFASTPEGMPIQLWEIGSSAGLNLLADRFCFIDELGDTHGPVDSPVQLDDAWRGRLTGGAWPRIVGRYGSDAAPIDAGSTEGRLALTAYVWPDQEARHERLKGALSLFSDNPVLVERMGAVEAVESIELEPGALTVLWHSVMWQYLPDEDQRAIERRLGELGSEATAEQPLVHLFLEPWRRSPEARHEFLVVMRTWPAGEEQVLATAAGHGIPCVWE